MPHQPRESSRGPHVSRAPQPSRDFQSSRAPQPSQRPQPPQPVEPTQPVQQSQPVYELRKCEHNDGGLFAVKPIEPGDCIIEESRFLTVPDVSTEDLLDRKAALVTLAAHVYAAFRVLGKGARKEYLSLKLQSIPVYLGIRVDQFMLENRLRVVNKCYGLGVRDVSQLDEVMSVWASSYWTDHAREEFIPKMISWIRHSCVPNAVVNWDPPSKKFTVFAIQRIEKDGQIFAARDDFISEPFETRQWFWKKLELDCNCTACGPEKRRVRLEELEKETPRNQSGSSNVDREIKVLEEMISLLSLEEGLMKERAEM